MQLKWIPLFLILDLLIHLLGLLDHKSTPPLFLLPLSDLSSHVVLHGRTQNTSLTPDPLLEHSLLAHPAQSVKSGPPAHAH